MKEAVIKMGSTTEFYIDERCYIAELSNTDNDPELSIARVRVEPGVTTNWHDLRDTAERYYILSGRGRVEIGDSTVQDVASGDMVIIPPECRQRIANTGTEDLFFLAICSPRFSDSVYQDLEVEIS